MTEPEVLIEARLREKAQTLFYRGLAAAAEEAGDAALVDVFNDLHADEQHHLSRLTARLLEMGVQPAPLHGSQAPTLPGLDAWRPVARARERDEVAFYEGLLTTTELGADSRAVVEEIVQSERHHYEHLAGKWMSA